MAFFDDLGKKVTEAGQKTLQKTKDLSDTARLHAMISDEEKRINDMYFQVGRLYVSRHWTDYEADFSGMFGVIADADQKIRQYQKQLLDLRGVRICERCGAEMSQNSAFCSNCGASILPVQPAAMPRPESADQ